MKKMLFHILSGQSLQNYIAAKIINPDVNFYLYTTESKNNLTVHKEVLGENIESELIASWDYSEVHNKILNIIDKYSNYELILNFTGGNKIISQAAFNAFRLKKKDCLYINSQNDEYIYFDNISDNNKIYKKGIKIKSSITDFLGLNGQKINLSSKKETEPQKKLRIFLEDNYRLYSSAILRFASKFDPKRGFGKFNSLEIQNGKLKGTFLNYENGISYIKFVHSNKQKLILNEKGPELLEYLTGKWFETSCFLKIKKMNYFDEMHENARLEKNNKPTYSNYDDKNEFDIIASKGIYPVIFECKSGGIKQEFIDKLFNFKQTYLGRYSSVFFITFFPVNMNNEYEILLHEKLEDNKIKIINYKQLNGGLKSFFNKRDNLR